MAPSSVFVKAGVVALAAFTSSAAAAVAAVPTEYKVADVYQGQTFFDQFNFNDVCIVGAVYRAMLNIDRMLTQPTDSSTSRARPLPKARD
jgi:hypothetical protein